MLVLFGAGGMLLTMLPPLALLAGFVLPLAVLVLKAASILLLESRAWRWMTASAWRSTIVVLSVVVTAWWVIPAVIEARASGANEPVAQAQHGSTPTEHGTTGAGAEHGTPAPAGEHGATAVGGEHGAAGGEHAEQGPQKFANVITVLSRAFPNAEWAHFLHHYEAVIFAWLVGLIIILVAMAATRAPQLIPGKLQNLVESLVEGLHNFIAGIIGEKHASRFVPFLGTLGIYIWVMNLFGLIPFMDSPTSNLNVTFALAIVVFLYAQWIGIRGLGVVGYVDHLMGQPRNLTSWLLVPLMLPIHILGELAKPISLSCRLFGNVFGEDMLLVAFVSLGVTTLAWSNLPIGLPLQLPFLFLALLTGTLQAMVFMVLSTIYILLMLPHDHDHEAHEGAAAHAAH
jgi:F-type H+-transporting ATPase subunit a